MGEKVEMNAKKQSNEEGKHELSYDELKTIALQLSDENQKLRQSVNNMNYQITITQLDYLLKILCSGKFNEEIESKCNERIIDIMDLRDKPKPPPKDDTQPQPEE